MPLMGARGGASVRGFGRFGVVIPNEVSLNNFLSIETRSTSNAYMYGLALDSTGIIYTSGGVIASTNRDSQVNKYSSNGTRTWGRTFYRSPGTRYEYSSGIVVDSSDNVYAISNPDIGSQSLRISKVNSDGTFSYSRNYVPGSGNGYIIGCTTDPSGNIIVCGRGYYHGSAWLNTTMKFDSSGTLIWQRRYGTASEDFIGYASACDSSGNVYVAGARGTLGTASSYRGFIIKYNSSGTLQWQYQYNEGVLGGGLYNLKIDSNNNLYATGYVGTGASTIATLLKLNTSGDIVWQRKFTGGTGYYFDPTFDSNGNIYISGSDGTNSAWFKYNSSGTLQLQRKITNNIFNNLVYKTASLHFLGNTTNEHVLSKVPSDGSLTGTYSVGGISMVYSTLSLTDAAGTFSKSTLTYTDTANDWTETSSGNTANSSNLLSRNVTSI